MTLNEDVKSVPAWLAERYNDSENPDLPEPQRRRAKAEFEAMQNRMDIYEKANPDEATDWNLIAVKGQSGIEQTKEGVYKAVIKLSNGVDVETVFEEFVESDLAAFLATGQATEARMLSALDEVERLTGDKYLLGHTGGQDAAKDTLALKEAYSRLAHVFVRGKNRTGDKAVSDVAYLARTGRAAETRIVRSRLVAAMNAGQVDAALVARLKAAAEWMKATVSRAIRLTRARRAAGGTLAIDEFLNKSIGLEADAQHAAGVVAEAARILPPESQPTDNESQIVNGDGPGFSLSTRSADSLNQSAPLLEITSEDIGPDRSDWRRAVRDYIAARLQGRIIVNDDSGLEIKFTSESKSEAPAKLRRSTGFQAARRIEDITMSALSLGWKAEAKGRTDGTRGFHYFAMPVRVDGRPHIAWFNARMTNEGTYVFYEFGLSAQKEARTTQGFGDQGADSVAPQSGLGLTVGEFLENVKSTLPAAQGLTEGTAPANPEPSFRLSPIATLDRLAADIERRKRDPEMLRKIYDNMQAALTTLRFRWSETQQRWNGESPPVIEQKSKKELDKEQAFREAVAYADAEESIYGAMSAESQAALGMTGEDTSAFGGPLAKRFTYRKFGYSGRIVSKSAMLKRAAEWENVSAGGEHDGAAGLPSMFFGGTLTADEAAQEAFEAGEIDDAKPDTLWDAMRRELQTQAKSRDAMKAALDTLKAEQKLARNTAREEAANWRAEQDEMQAKDWDARAVMLRHLRTLDALLSGLPPEIRSKVGGWTAVASLKTQAAMLKELENRLAMADREVEIYLRKDALASIKDAMENARPDAKPGEKSKGKLGAITHAWFDSVEKAMGFSQKDAETRMDEIEGASTNGNLEAEAMDALTEEYGRLMAFGGLDKRGAGELTDILDQLEIVYARGREGWQAVLNDRRGKTGGAGAGA